MDRIHVAFPDCQIMVGEPGYLNITDEELRKTLTGVWEHRRQLKAVGE